MNNLYAHLKKMMPVAESVGEVNGVAMNENWCGLYDRVTITGNTRTGHSFELTLEIKLEKKEDDTDGN